MARTLALVMFLMASCVPPDRTPGALLDPLGDRHAERESPVAAQVAPPSDRGTLRYHMRARFHDLRELHAMLADGRLVEARALAFMVSRPVDDARLAELTPESEREAKAALAVARATSAEEARRLAPRIVEACAGCHTRAGVEVAGLDALQSKELAIREP